MLKHITRALCLVAASGLALMGQIGFGNVGVASGRRWYVDHQNGSDTTNTGRSASSPYKTIAKVFTNTLSNHDQILLKGGTCETYRESITLNATGLLHIRVAGYGGSPQPLLDETQVISGNDGCGYTGSTTWTNDASDATGKTWSFPITSPSDLTGFSNLYINGSPVTTLATSQANCEATLNSYFVSNAGGSGASFTMPGGGPYTVYWHSNSTTNPGSTGQLIEFSYNTAGVNGANTSNVVIDGITCRGNHTNNGCLVVGPNSFILNATARDGGKHNALCADGCHIYNLTLTNAWYNSIGSEMLVQFDPASASIGSWINGLTVSLAAFDNSINAMFSHITGGTGLGTSNVSNVSITNAPFGAAIGTNSVMSNITATNTGNMVVGGSGTFSMTNVALSPASGQNAMTVLAGSTGSLSMNNVTLNCTNATNGCLNVQGAEPITITNSSLTNTKPFDSEIFVSASVTLPLLNISNTTFFDPTSTNFIVAGLGVPTSATFAGNTYHFGNGAYMQWPTSTYYDMANAGLASFNALVGDTTSKRVSP